MTMKVFQALIDSGKWAALVFFSHGTPVQNKRQRFRADQKITAVGSANGAVAKIPEAAKE